MNSSSNPCPALPLSATYHVLRGDHVATATEMSDYLDANAHGLAIDHEVTSRMQCWTAASIFWSRVGMAIVRIQTDSHDRPAEDCRSYPGR